MKYALVVLVFEYRSIALAAAILVFAALPAVAIAVFKAPRSHAVGAAVVCGSVLVGTLFVGPFAFEVERAALSVPVPPSGMEKERDAEMATFSSATTGRVTYEYPPGTDVPGLMRDQASLLNASGWRLVSFDLPEAVTHTGGHTEYFHGWIIATRGVFTIDVLVGTTLGGSTAPPDPAAPVKLVVKVSAT